MAPRLIGHPHTKRTFPDVFARRKTGFIPSRFVSSPRPRRNKAGPISVLTVQWSVQVRRAVRLLVVDAES
jgi:hypothetical protein